MLEKVLFVTKMFLDGWEKLLLEDVFVSLKKFLLKLIELWDQGTTSAELAQEWQQAYLSASARTVRPRLLEDGLVSRKPAKKPLITRKNIRERLIFCKRYRDCTAEDWGKVIVSDVLKKKGQH